MGRQRHQESIPAGSPGLTLGSTRTPPALSSVLSHPFAISASFSASAQAVPVSPPVRHSPNQGHIMRFLMSLLFFGLNTLSAQATHSISGLVKKCGPVTNQVCEISCLDCKGGKHKIRLRDNGEYTFHFIPLGPAIIEVIIPSNIFGYNKPIANLEEPFMYCTQDITCDLLLLHESANCVISLRTIASSLPCGTSHFHPNQNLEWRFQ